MERKKKIISLLLLVTLCLFSGCGTGNKNVSSAAKSETKQTVSKEAATEEDYIVPDDLKEQSQEQKADRKKKKEQTTEQNKEEKLWEYLQDNFDTKNLLDVMEELEDFDVDNLEEE